MSEGKNGPVRKQYHFWPGENGLDAWDVDRLILLADNLPVAEVEVDAIAEIDTVYWFGDGFPAPTVREVVLHARLMQDADSTFPVILGPDGRVMDGMHRIARAILDGRPTVRARRFETLPEPDFRNCQPGDLPYD